jgi:uncharacterized protein (DUF433 family)
MIDGAQAECRNMNDDNRHGYIVRTPGICGGKPRIDGHRIKVQHIVVEHEQMGMRPDEICDAHPGLTLSQVYAALAYYFDHRDEILEDIKADEKYAEEFRRQHPESVR